MEKKISIYFVKSVIESVRARGLDAEALLREFDLEATMTAEQFEACIQVTATPRAGP